MPGLDKDTPVPTDIKLHKVSKMLELNYAELNEHYELPCEYLRVMTPSAEARGHGPGQEVLQHGCQGVGIERIEPVGNYALRLVFSDGHDSGLYSWDLLYELGKNHAMLWGDYLKRIELAGLSRAPRVAAQPVELNRWRHNVGAADKHGHEHD